MLLINCWSGNIHVLLNSLTLLEHWCRYLLKFTIKKEKVIYIYIPIWYVGSLRDQTCILDLLKHLRWDFFFSENNIFESLTVFAKVFYDRCLTGSPKYAPVDYFISWRGCNRKIERINKRLLRLILNNSESSFQDMLSILN